MNFTLADCAMRRYPDMPPDLAIMCFESDRRHAGLGALDERKRNGHEISNLKRMEPMKPAIVYVLRVNRPTRMEIAWPEIDLVPWGTEVEATKCVTATRMKAVNKAICVSFHPRDFYDQQNRGFIAHELRRARRQLRAAVRSPSQAATG